MGECVWMALDPAEESGEHTVVTRVLDVRPYRDLWVVEVEVSSWGGYSRTTIICNSQKEAREVQTGDTVTI